MKKEKMTKNAAKGVVNVLNSVLRTEANTTSCLALCQPKAPKELSQETIPFLHLEIIYSF